MKVAENQKKVAAIDTNVAVLKRKLEKYNIRRDALARSRVMQDSGSLAPNPLVTTAIEVLDEKMKAGQDKLEVQRIKRGL